MKERENIFAQQQQSVPMNNNEMELHKCVENTLSCAVSQINAFLQFMQKFKMAAAKNAGKMVFFLEK